MRVSKAEWAAGVFWDDVIDKPDLFPSGPVDMSSITGKNFPSGTIPRFDGTRFVPAIYPSVTPTPTPTPSPGTEIIAYWDPDSLEPLQSIYEEFAFNGAMIGDEVIVGVESAPAFMLISAIVSAIGMIRITLTNMTADLMDPPAGNYYVRVFT